MGDHQALIHKLQILIAGTLIIAICFLISLILTTANTNKTQATASSDAFSSGSFSDANVVAAGMADLASGLQRTVLTMQQGVLAGLRATGNGIGTIASAIAGAGRHVANATRAGLVAGVHSIGSVFVFVGNTGAGGIMYAASIPGNIVGSVSGGVTAFLRPSESVDVPIIDPNSPELQAALATLPPTENLITPQGSSGPVWPMHGAITTYFGVPHRPYQHTHTGIDISDGTRPGTTPIKPFRPGRVTDVVWSNKGLGNHVIVDHGNGVTSVYAHLHSIAVRIGQDVTLDTTLGMEGTTGVSTGTHLHFEIRVNGEATDPQQFISGRP